MLLPVARQARVSASGVAARLQCRSVSYWARKESATPRSKWEVGNTQIAAFAEKERAGRLAYHLSGGYDLSISPGIP